MKLLLIRKLFPCQYERMKVKPVTENQADQATD
jgi:hypothetical protein